jgi:tRNA modification GTPase
VLDGVHRYARDPLSETNELNLDNATVEQIEIGAEQLRRAIKALGRITGHVDVEALLEIIFRDFCIGK